MEQVELRNILGILEDHPQVNTLIFTGGNSKNGPEYFSRKAVKEKGLTLEVVDSNIPRKHQFHWAGRTLTTISLTAPSGAANRAIGSMDDYKTKKAKNSAYTTFDFRVEQYAKVFIQE